MNPKTVHDAINPQTLRAALSKVAAASRRLRRGREKRARPAWFAELSVGTAPSLVCIEPVEAAEPDPVRIAVLAMESLGRASMRASFTGMEVEVAVPDATTAQIFRAALAETIRTRPTDKLVRVVVP